MLSFLVGMGTTQAGAKSAHTTAMPAPNVSGTLKVDLASRSAWTFQPEDEAVPAKTLPVPYGGWRLNGFPNATGGTYRRLIAIPKLTGGEAQTTEITFEAVNWEAVVSVGKDAAHLHEAGRHLSAWTPFKVDVSRYVTPGQTALLQVKVRDRNSFMDAEGRFTVPAGTEWNDRQARGIIRGVSLRALPALHIEDVFVKPDTRTNSLTYACTLRNSSSHSASFTLAAHLSAATPGAQWRYPTLPALPRVSWTAESDLKPGETRTLTSGPIPWTPGKAAWWWPNVPFQPNYRAQLHRLSVELHPLRIQGKVGLELPTTQTETVRFGFCTPGQKGITYTLNGVRINLRGDSLPEGTIGTDAFARLPGFLPPTKTNSGWPGAVRNYQRLNFNVVRMHQVPCTRYMMDVCDELGLLVIPETAIRGGGVKKENIEVNPDAFVTHLRELIQRDRNHPSVFKWSLENELFGAPEPFMRRLYDACMQEDGTRPCSIDDNAEYPAWPRFAVIEHYSQPAGTPDAQGGRARQDRPFGQGEYVWPHGNTPPGALWFGLTTRSLRARDNADVRPYTLVDVWPGVIPGLTPTNFPDPPLPPDGLEQGGRALITAPQPWLNARLALIQRSFAPVAAFDRAYDATNTPSNGSGVYPAIFPLLPVGKSTRLLTLFNDEFSGNTLELKVDLIAHPTIRQSLPLGTVKRTVIVPLGGHAEFPVPFIVPASKNNNAVEMQIVIRKNGLERFRDRLFFTVQGTAGAQVHYEGRDDKTQGTWQGAYGRQAFLFPVRGGLAQFHDSGVDLQRGTGFESEGGGLNTGDPDESGALFELDKAFQVTDPRVPPAGNGLTERHPLAFRGGRNLAFRADAPDGKSHLVSLYLLDYQRKGLAVDIDVFDLQGHPLDTRRIDNYGDGAYIRYRFTGSVVLIIRSLTPGAPPLLSSAFIDE